MKDVSNLKSELGETKMEVLNQLNEAVAKREQAQEHLRVLMTQNRSCLQKLQSKIQREGTGALQYLVPSRAAVDSSSIRKELKKEVNEAKEESHEAGGFLRRVIAIPENSVIESLFC
jgi:hypothetical protein